MQNFAEFFESISIAIPTLITDSPYTDLTFTTIDTNAVVRFKSGGLGQKGFKIESTTDSIMNITIIQCYFDIVDQSNLNLNYILIWQNKRYKITDIKVQQYVIPCIITIAEYINEANIY